MSSLLLLAGYLILPATFQGTSDLRVSQAGIGIFGVALLTAGFSLTAFLCFAVKNVLFQADAIFLPSLTSCAIGLLNIFYDFLVYSRYSWKTPALLLTIAGSISTLVYGGLLIFMLRKISNIKLNRPGTTLLSPNQPRDSESALWQDPSYYDNYVRNMFPASIHRQGQQFQHTSNNGGYDSNSITEEEMQRQQMLMLLLAREPQASTAPDVQPSTFRIDWQGRDEEDPVPAQGYYAPPSSCTPTPQTAYSGPSPALTRRFTGDLQPWDGVWRTPARVSPVASRVQRHDSQEWREARRNEIEQGR